MVSLPSLHLWSQVVSINTGSHFMLYLDGVVDNLLPAARPFLIQHYGTDEEGSRNWELMVSLRTYGLAVGCLLSMFLSGRWGRKPQVVLGMSLNIIGVLLTCLIMIVPGGLTAAHYGRFINGCGQGLVQTVFACIGELFSMVISLEELLGNERLWYWAMAFPIIPLVPAILVILRSPESPRYLFMEGKREEAMASLDYYQDPVDARKTVAELVTEMAHNDTDINSNGGSLLSKRRESSSSPPCYVRFLEGRFLRPLFVGCILHSLVHLDDWLWISYSTHIFEKHGFDVSSAQKASLGMSLPQSLCSIGLISIFDRFPRKTLLVLPTLASAFIGSVSIFSLRFGAKDHQHVSLLSCLLPFLASLDLCTAGIAGESAFTIVPELFLYQDRILGTAICGIAQSVFGGLLLNFLLSAINLYGTDKVLIPFVVGNVLYALFTIFYVPETSMKSPQASPSSSNAVFLFPLSRGRIRDDVKEVADALEKTFSRRKGVGMVERARDFVRRLMLSPAVGFAWQMTVFVAQLLICFVIVNSVILIVSLVFPRASSILIVPDRHILRAIKPE